MAKLGRPTKKTPETVEKILSALKLGLYRNTACSMAGIHSDTLRVWMHEDPDLERRVIEAEADPIGIAAGRLLAAVHNGELSAIKFFLEKRAPEFKERIEDKAAGPADIAAAMIAAFAAMKASDGIGDDEPDAA